MIILLAWTVGVVVGTFITLYMTDCVLREYKTEADYWRQQAIDSMETAVREFEKRRREKKRDDADWWKE